MIHLTRMHNRPFLLNSDLIEMVEETPDTVVTMTTGRKFLVEESAGEILERVIHFRNRCFIDPAFRIEPVKEVEKQA
jgi:flagellar protein FlbD